MEWGFFPPLAELLADRGFVVVRFNVSGAGMVPGDDVVSSLEAFKTNTHGREMADLLAILDATGESIAPGRVDRGRLGLLGHSRGGGNAILAAGREPWRDRVRALVTWASVATFDRYSPEQKAAWRDAGRAAGRQRPHRPEARPGGRPPERDRSPRGSGRSRRRPDRPGTVADRPRRGRRDVSVADADRLSGAFRASPDSHELVRIPGASHTFGARHPFVGPTPHLIQAMNATQRWFRRHLAAG